jgi:putative addiction module CopG family antidote
LVLSAIGKNTSFSVGEHFTRFIEAQVSQGRYGNVSDVVRAGLRLFGGARYQARRSPCRPHRG